MSEAVVQDVLSVGDVLSENALQDVPPVDRKDTSFDFQSDAGHASGNEVHGAASMSTGGKSLAVAA